MAIRLSLAGGVFVSTVNPGRQSGGRSGITTGLKVTSALLAFGLLVQAWLGSTGFYTAEPDLVTGHEMLGNVFFLVAIVQVALAFFAMHRGLASRSLLIVSVLLLAGVVAQLGLGYAGRESADAMAWHLPNGVLLMGLCTASAVMVWGRPARN